MWAVVYRLSGATKLSVPLRLVALLVTQASPA